jgi:hypothetical protein
VTRDDIIRNAEAELVNRLTSEAIRLYARAYDAGIAAERERMDLNAIHSCHAECQNPFCVRVREAVAHEREACAKVCEEIAERNELENDYDWIPGNFECATAIRARGNTGIKWEVEP